MNDFYSRYCERDASGWFAEPLNTASGLAFFVSAWQLWRQLDTTAWRREWDLHLLVLLVALVGVTTVFWHGSGVRWLLWVDGAMIAAFAAAYWTVFLVRTQGLGVPGVLAAWLPTAAVVGLMLGWLPLTALGGTPIYLPLVVMLLAALFLALRVDRRLARDLLLATVILVLALVVRAVDTLLCAWVVVGTHWLWQILFAILLFVLVDGLLRHKHLREAQALNGQVSGESELARPPE